MLGLPLVRAELLQVAVSGGEQVFVESVFLGEIEHINLP